MGTFVESFEEVSHPTGTTYGREQMLLSLERFLRLPGARVRHEILATLGDGLVLVRRWMGASAAGRERFDVGEYEKEEVCVFQIDARGNHLRTEIFAADHLGDAVAAMYGRYAESLPPGPEREYATVTARAVAFILLPGEGPGLEQIYAPTYVDIDHRSVGYGTLSREDSGKLLESWRDLAEDTRRTVVDVLALDGNGVVRKTKTTGVWRDGGGAFERTVCTLTVFGPDGRVTSHETFDADREAEALARFDALTADTAPGSAPRRGVHPPRVLRANAASAAVARFDAALAARDEAALADALADTVTVVDHANGADYGRDGLLRSFRQLLRMDDTTIRHELLATLGASLGLVRQRIGGRGGLDAGAYERDEICVYDVDPDGRFRHVERSAAERLRSAVVRLYERYAESLPEGPARARAGGVARALATYDGVLDADRIASGHAPSVVSVDHRTLHTWSARGREEWRRQWREQGELTVGAALRDDDVLALDPGGSVLRTTFAGVSRATGGAFENVVIIVVEHGPDGLITRMETFEPDQEAEALACFAALVAGEQPAAPSRRRVRANAATPSIGRFQSALAARDRDALGDVFAESLHFTHHPTGATYGRREMLGTWRSIMKAERMSFHGEALGTLGETLVLERHALAIDGLREGHLTEFGRIEFDEAVVIEVDDAGRWCRVELFEAERLGDAVARLYARHAERLPEGPARRRAAMTARAVATMLTRSTEHSLADVSTPDIEAVDHRAVGMGTVSGPDLWTRWREASDELTQNPSRAARGRGAALQRDDKQTFRVEDVLALGPDALLRRTTETGNVRASGGAFENGIWILSVFGPDGRQSRVELFDVGRETEALARYDALVGPAGEPSAPAFANAASATVDPVIAALIAHDWRGFAALFADEFRMSDRRRVVQLELDREQYIAFTREIADGRTIRATSELLATRGERLALTRRVQEFRDADVGPSEIAFLILTEADARGRIAAQVRWDVEDLAAAYVELDRRWQADEMRSHARVAAFHDAFTRELAARDWDGLAALLSPALVAHDHRLVGWDVRHGPGAYVDVVRAMVDLAPDADGRLDHARTCERGFLAEVVWVGTRDGGAFESPFVWVVELDDAGRAARFDFYDPHHLEAARARFAEIDLNAPTAGLGRNASPAALGSNARPGALGVSRDRLSMLGNPNLATAAMERWHAAYAEGFDTGNWDAMRGLVVPGYVFDDRRRLVLVGGDAELMIASAGERAATGARPQVTVVGFAGDRVAVTRMLWSGGPPDGRFEIEYLGVSEVDDTGRFVAQILFDADAARAAQREAWARWSAIEPDIEMHLTLLGRFADAFNARDLGAFLATVADDVVVVDRRRSGVRRIEGAESFGARIEASWGFAPGSKAEVGWRWPAYDRHGVLTVVHRHGTRAEESPNEREYLQLFVQTRGRFTNIEMFDLEDLDAALARFEALRDAPA